MYLTEFVNSVKQVKSNWNPYKDWEKQQEIHEAQRKELEKKVQIPNDQLDHAANYGRTLIDTINVMDTYSINKAQDVEVATQSVMNIPIVLASFIPLRSIHKLNGESLFSGKPIKLSSYGLPFLSLAVIYTLGIGFNKYLEKQASRIARYQSREKELKDPRNFVIYDNEQINAAKQIAKTLADLPKKEKKSIFSQIPDSIATIKSLKSDYKDYNKWKEDYKKAEQEKIAHFDANTPKEELNEAKNSQESILGAIKHIEIVSQNYLNNAEMALNTLTETELVGGVIIGSIVSRIAKLLTGESNIFENIFNSTTKEPITAGKLGKIALICAPAIVPFTAIIVTALLTIPLHKEAAKIGRYKAKQELLEDPKNFISFSDEQIDSIKNIKVPDSKEKNFLDKFVDQFKFLIKFYKDYKEYEKYNKTQKIEEEKIDKALKSLNLKPGQLEEAKSLQKKVFMSFEKMDEKVQRYGDDVEAATDISRRVLSQVIGLVNLLLTMYVMGKDKEFNFKKIAKLSALPSIIGTLMMVYSIKIKKQAIKIGLMEAMKDLDDPRNFVDKSTTQAQQTVNNSAKTNNSTASSKKLDSQKFGNMSNFLNMVNTQKS